MKLIKRSNCKVFAIRSPQLGKMRDDRLNSFSFEKSGTQATEVRRMFLERKDIAGYKAYTAKQNDP